MQRRISILGSTGSIGRQALEVIEASPDQFTVVALAAYSNVELLAEQAWRHRPNLAVAADESRLPALKEKLKGSGVEVVGWEGLGAVASLGAADAVVAAISGAAGLLPVMAAVRAGKIIALANKEALVVAGELVTREAEKSGAKLIPVDSEHSAIFQCLQGQNSSAVRRLVLTASGGALRDWPQEELSRASPEQALAHPNWRMGPKVTIDSATLMNKGLEIIEARWLFRIDADRIDVMIHRQSIVHGMVQLSDGCILAQMSKPDMRLPIQYALSYPQRIQQAWGALDLNEALELTFEPPDEERYPCLALARESARKMGTAPAVLNAANEEAVELFLKSKIAFTDIARLVDTALSRHQIMNDPTLEDILKADQEARRAVAEEVKSWIRS
jgi:1-deoxy-D-xylulose-5-phosphate reductoisomerase